MHQVFPSRVCTYEVRKIHKRLHVTELETGAVVYTPPDFVKLPNRAALRDLADAFTAAGCRRDIGAIIAFESTYSIRP